MRPEPGRKLKLKVNIRDRDFFPETVEQEDIDVIALQTNADCLVMFPEKISILRCTVFNVVSGLMSYNVMPIQMS